MSSSTMGLVSGIASFFDGLIFLAVDIALLVAVFTAVRRNRPAALPALATYAIIDVVADVTRPVVYAVLPLFARSSGFQDYAIAFAAIGVAFALVHAVAMVALIVGIVRLATPEPFKPGA